MLKKFIFSLLPVLILFLVAETAFRLIPVHNRTATVAGFVEPDPDLIWRLKARPDLPLNDLGFRGAAFDSKADVKILILGDSVSWGDGIPDEENIYPSLLKKELRNLDPAKTYEVINASVPGYSTFQELRYLELYGLGLKPDMIVLQFCLNDIFERYGSLASYGGDNMFLGIDTRKAIPGITGFLVCHSKAFEAFFRWMQHKSRNRQAYSVNNLMKDSLSSELTTAFENTLAEIDGIRSVASKNNLPFLVFVPPYQIQLSDPANLGQPQKILTGYCLSRKVPFLDILPQFSVLANERKLVLFNDESHFSEAGHAVAAKMMAKAIDDVLRQKQTGPQKTPG